MEKNYYEILQIDKNALPEIVEKAYKTLVKKYHPDLQEGSLKKIYENKLKLINEAYNVLSNEEKRKQYDFEIQQKEREKQQNDNTYKSYKNTNSNTSHIQYHTMNNNLNYNIDKLRKQEAYKQEIEIQKQKAYEQEIKRQKKYNEQLNNAIKQAYHDAYIQDLKNRGYKIKYKKTFNHYMKNFIIIIIFIIILILLWHIPFIKNYFINIYNKNEIIQYIVNLIINFYN